jgi:hypothetical protein
MQTNPTNTNPENLHLFSLEQGGLVVDPITQYCISLLFSKFSFSPSHLSLSEMASVKKMAKPIADEGSQETFRTVGVRISFHFAF